MSRDPLHITAEALFRYQWVAEIRTRVLAGEGLSQAIQAVRHHPRPDPQGRARKPSKRSLYRWYAAFRADGLLGLEPVQRPRVPDSRVLEAGLLDLLRESKIADPQLSVPELIKIARAQGVLSAGQKVSRTTVWRACRRMGLPMRRSEPLQSADTRRFAYPHRMMMVLCDGKHFRAGAQRLKRVALSFLDDATRFGLGILVGTAESTVLFLRLLYEVLLRYGLINALYLDHGPGFISGDTRSVLARLAIHLVHGRVRYPQGHGKVERYHRTLKQQVLRCLPAHPEVDPDCSALTLRLNRWLREQYNHTPHESLDGKTPSERWLQDARDLRMPQDRAWLDAGFLITQERRVSNDHVVSLDGTLYEVPAACHGRIGVDHHLISGQRTVRLQGRDVQIHPLDVTRNALDRRAQHQKPAQVASNPSTAAEQAFQEDFAPLVDSQGNYPDPQEDS